MNAKPRSKSRAAAQPARSSSEPRPAGARASSPSDAAGAAPSPPSVAPAGDPVAARRWHWMSLGIAAAAGVLWFLGCPPWNLWPLAWIAMVPTLVVVERASTTRRAFLYAWVTGTVGNLGGFYWIAELLKRFAFMPWVAAIPILLLFAAYQGLIFAAFGGVARVIRRHYPALPMALVAPLAMVTFELVTPVVFPFHVAITQAWVLHVIQVADLAGPLGVTALLLMVNGAVYDLWKDRGARARTSAIAGFVLLAALAYGHFRIRDVAQRRALAPQVSLGIVQPNVSFDMKGDDTREQFATRQLRDLHEQSRALAAAGAELIVWPETAYPYAISRREPGDFPADSGFRIHDGFDVPVVVGAVTRVPRRAGGARSLPYNSALMLDRDGRFTGRFDKQYLMLFGEYTPGRDLFPNLARLMPATAGHYARGDQTTTLPFVAPDGHEYRLGAMICYEDILPSFGRALAPLRPHLLVNLTNDAWFGETSEPWEHLALSVFRAVEMRTDLVRAVNTGVSAYVDATGRVYQRTYAVNPVAHPRGADHTLAHVALMEGGHTVFAAVGNLFAYLCALATLGLWLVLPRVQARRGRRDAGGSAGDAPPSAGAAA